MKKKLILVTGAPRSGTTVVGKIASLNSDTNYLMEPLNNRLRRGIPDYYPYVGSKTNSDKRQKYNSLIAETIRLRNLQPQVTILPQDKG